VADRGSTYGCAVGYPPLADRVRSRSNILAGSYRRPVWNVTTGPALGALLRSASGNSVVVFGPPLRSVRRLPVHSAYVVPAAQTRHVITDLAPLDGIHDFPLWCRVGIIP